jgi:hypothetical protein
MMSGNPCPNEVTVLLLSHGGHPGIVTANCDKIEKHEPKRHEAVIIVPQVDYFPEQQSYKEKPNKSATIIVRWDDE